MSRIEWEVKIIAKTEDKVTPLPRNTESKKRPREHLQEPSQTPRRAYNSVGSSPIGSSEEAEGDKDAVNPRIEGSPPRIMV